MSYEGSCHCGAVAFEVDAPQPTQAFARGAMPDGTPTRAVNLRCVPAVDLDALQIQRVDGASF